MLVLHPEEARASEPSLVKEAQGNARQGAVLFSLLLSRLDAIKVLTCCLQQVLALQDKHTTHFRVHDIGIKGSRIREFKL